MYNFSKNPAHSYQNIKNKKNIIIKVTLNINSNLIAIKTRRLIQFNTMAWKTTENICILGYKTNIVNYSLNCILK